MLLPPNPTYLVWERCSLHSRAAGNVASSWQRGSLGDAEAVGDFLPKKQGFRIAQAAGSEEDSGGGDGPEAVKEGSTAGPACGVMTEDRAHEGGLVK